MKRSMIIIFVLVTLYSNAQKSRLDMFNMNITIPAGWTITQEEDGYGCYSPDRQSVIVIMEDAEHSISFYDVALLSGVDIGGGTTIQTTGRLNQITASTAYAPIWVITNNGNAKGWGGLKQTKSGGVIGFVAIASPANLDAVKSKMLSMLASCEEVATSTNSEALQRWMALLTSNHLEGGFSSYSYGGGQGGGSSSTYDFCTNGRYRYSYEYSSSISGTSTETEYGTWRLYDQSGSIVVVLTSNRGSSSRFSLTQKEGVIYLNKKGYLKTEYRPVCR